VIACEQRIFPFKGICHVVGGMTGRRDRLDFPCSARHNSTILQRDVRLKVAVGAGIERVKLANMERASGPVRALGIHSCTGRLFDRRHCR
jgi:hypothetical protein